MPQTVEQAHALLRVLVEQLAELGVTATFNTATGDVVLPGARERPAGTVDPSGGVHGTGLAWRAL